MSAVPCSRWLLHLPEPTGDWKQRWLACSNDGEPGSIVLTPPLSSAPICHHSAGWSCLQCFSPQMRWIISCPSRMLHSCHPRLLLPPCSWQFWHLVISLLLLHLDPYPPLFFYSPSFCHFWILSQSAASGKRPERMFHRTWSQSQPLRGERLFLISSHYCIRE